RIRGREYPDEWILAGNHRDAWVFGGSDPSSGTASMMEMTRGLGRLLQQGIRPRRTLVFLSWDGEETSFAGSAEWSEQFDQELRQKAVAYLNVDMAATGPNFQGQSIGSLAPLLVETSKSVLDPSGKSLYDAWQKSRAKELQESGDGEPLTDFNLSETRVGSGSDYAALLDHAGVPIIDLTFDGPYGVYHSAYDNYYWMNHFGDPGYRYQTLMAQLWGVLALRLSNADLLPFDFSSYGAHVRQYLDTLAKEQDLNLLDLRSLRTAIDDFERAGRALEATKTVALVSGKLDPMLADQLNRGVMGLERNFLAPEGIPERPWYRHLVYACRQTYAHLELPGLTEAAETGDWVRAQQQAARLEAALRTNASLLRELNQELACSGGFAQKNAPVCAAP
ncbi:MAG TPA: transferrin receptor-like dimerization domain-containing protein, partial [Steroidobacteraceae bacterium]|nr:transferrin receptor-like dimerization domain-containing protein [Steroidobacteraceae bacterium]